MFNVISDIKSSENATLVAKYVLRIKKPHQEQEGNNIR
jgi:hypothetical protein